MLVFGALSPTIMEVAKWPFWGPVTPFLRGPLFHLLDCWLLERHCWRSLPRLWLCPRPSGMNLGKNRNGAERSTDVFSHMWQVVKCSWVGRTSWRWEMTVGNITPIAYIAYWPIVCQCIYKNILQSRSACFKIYIGPLYCINIWAPEKLQNEAKADSSKTPIPIGPASALRTGCWGDTAGHKEKGVLQVFFEMDEILTWSESEQWKHRLMETVCQTSSYSASQYFCSSAFWQDSSSLSTGSNH